MTPNWKGPYEGGITQSLIGKFLECPYRFYLYTILGLQEDSEPNDNLVWGDTFHKALELLIEKPYTKDNFTEKDWKEIDEAIENHLKTRYPLAPGSFRFSIKHMIRLYDDSYKEDATFKTEQIFSFPYKDVLLRGKVDGISLSSEILVEHKCKGKLDLDNRAEILQDLQVNMYCLATGAHKVIYDVIRIPDTQWSLPRKKVMEGWAPYMNRLYHTENYGDFPISRWKNRWLAQFNETIGSQDLKQYQQFTIDPLIEKVKRWWDHVTQPGFDPDNPSYYNDIFYKTPIRHFDPGKTERFKCSYWNYLTGAIGIDDLIPVEDYYAELQSDVSGT